MLVLALVGLQACSGSASDGSDGGARAPSPSESKRGRQVVAERAVIYDSIEALAADSTIVVRGTAIEPQTTERAEEIEYPDIDFGGDPEERLPLPQLIWTTLRIDEVLIGEYAADTLRYQEATFFAADQRTELGKSYLLFLIRAEVNGELRAPDEWVPVGPPWQMDASGLDQATRMRPGEDPDLPSVVPLATVRALGLLPG